MTGEVFYLGIDPHPQGQFRLRHVGRECKVWDFETQAEVLTLPWAISIVDYYCACSDSNATLYFENGVLDLVETRIAGLKEELAKYEQLISNIVDPMRKRAIATANSNRPGAGETSW